MFTILQKHLWDLESHSFIYIYLVSGGGCGWLTGEISFTSEPNQCCRGVNLICCFWQWDCYKGIVQLWAVVPYVEFCTIVGMTYLRTKILIKFEWQAKIVSEIGPWSSSLPPGSAMKPQCCSSGLPPPNMAITGTFYTRVLTLQNLMFISISLVADMPDFSSTVITELLWLF